MTSENLEYRIVRALRAEAETHPLTVTAEQVEDRLAQSPRLSRFTLMLVGASALAILAIAVIAGGAVPSGPFGPPAAPASPTSGVPAVTELPIGTWVSNSALESGSICVAISVERPDAAEHSAWWWYPANGPDCGPIPARPQATTADTSEVPLVRIATAPLPELSRELTLRLMGVSDTEINLHGVPFRRTDQAPPEATTSDTGCAVTRPEPAFVAPPPYPATAPPLYESEWFGSEALWTMLDRDGEVWSVHVVEKTFWWSVDWPGMRDEPVPALTVVATRLDGSGTVTSGPATNAAREDFGEAMLAGVEIPTAGCWQITTSYGDAVLSYVVLVTD